MDELITADELIKEYNEVRQREQYVDFRDKATSTEDGAVICDSYGI